MNRIVQFIMQKKRKHVIVNENNTVFCPRNVYMIIFLKEIKIIYSVIYFLYFCSIYYILFKCM